MNDFGFALAVSKDSATLIIHNPDGTVSKLSLDRGDVTTLTALLQHSIVLMDRHEEEDDE